MAISGIMRMRDRMARFRNLVKPTIAALAAILCVATASAQTITPQGRLTLTSGTPVMTADATAQTTVFYDCFAGNVVPVGATLTNLAIGSCEISMGLAAANVLSGSLYDVFAVNNSGMLAICVGPAWTSMTARGTGAGTTQIDQTNGGLWTNTNSLTHCWGGAAGTTDFGVVAAHAGTYLGSFYATGNGQTGMQFAPAAASGGSNNVLALWNAYNRVDFSSIERDSTASWTYSGTVWRAVNNSNGNRITWIDGLGYSNVAASYAAIAVTGVKTLEVGVNFDATSGTPGGIVGQEFLNSTTLLTTLAGGNTFTGVGLHFSQSMEAMATSGGTETSFSASALTLFLSM